MSYFVALSKRKRALLISLPIRSQGKIRHLGLSEVSGVTLTGHVLSTISQLCWLDTVFLCGTLKTPFGSARDMS